MNSHKLPLFVVGILLVVTAGIAWRQHNELQVLRRSAATRHDYAELERQLQQTRRDHRAELERLKQAPESKAESEQPSSLSGAGRAGFGSAPLDRNAAEQQERAAIQRQAAAIRELLTKPEVQNLLSDQKRATIEQRYAALFTQMNLAPEKIETLKALLMERASTMQDVFAAAREQGINLRTNPDAYKKLVTDVQDQLNGSIKAVIGEGGFDQLTGYERTLPQRTVVADLQQRLNYTGAPLTSLQSEQLVQILAANKPARPNPGDSGAAATREGAEILRAATNTVPGVAQLVGASDDTGRPALPPYPIAESALNQAQAVLTPSQFAALQQLYRQQQSQQQLKKLVTHTLVTNKPVTPPPPRKGG